jgi:hypothetical protein
MTTELGGKGGRILTVAALPQNDINGGKGGGILTLPLRFARELRLRMTTGEKPS